MKDFELSRFHYKKIIPPPLFKILNKVQSINFRKPVESAQPVQLIFEMPDGRLVQLNATPLEAIATDDPTVRTIR